MQKKSDAKKKSRKVLSSEKKKQLEADINSGKSTPDLVKKYKVTEGNIRYYKRKILEKKNKRPVSVLDLKKALDLAKANSMLHYAMEQMEVGMKRIDEDHEKHRPETQIKMAIEVAKITLDIHNTLYYMETPEFEAGYNEDDVDLAEMVMDMMTDKQKEELFEKYTGKALSEIGKPETKPDSSKPADEKK